MSVVHEIIIVKRNKIDGNQILHLSASITSWLVNWSHKWLIDHMTRQLITCEINCNYCRLTLSANTQRFPHFAAAKKERKDAVVFRH